MALFQGHPKQASRLMLTDGMKADIRHQVDHWVRSGAFSPYQAAGFFPELFELLKNGLMVRTH